MNQLWPQRARNELRAPRCAAAAWAIGQGTGTVGNLDNDLFIGLSDEPLFEQLRVQIQPEWMERVGAYGTRSQAGSTCTLSILFKAEEGREGGIRFVYGSESEGPPGDIAQFVTEAVRLTDPWHEKQRRLKRA